MSLHKPKLENSKTLKFIRSGMYNIEQLERHHLEMISVLSRWKESSSFKTAVKLPYIYPSPFLKLKKQKTLSNSINEKENYASAEQKDVNPELQPFGSNIPRLRPLDDSSQREYINYVTPRKEVCFPSQSLLHATPNSRTRCKPLGLSDKNMKRINITLGYDISNGDLPKLTATNSIKYNTEIAIIKQKMKMNQLDENYLSNF